jgi:HlyD family secretion protein
MILGNIQELYLRVSIDQLDIPYFHSTAPAIAFLQGDARVKFHLEFVGIEPYLVPKQNLTNELTETVDTRVLQIIYRLIQDNHPLYIGQQMDVFIEAKY